MGRDKALLRLSPSGDPLWRRQLDLLAALNPEELLWSGPPREGLPDHIRIVPDQIADTGPLGGIAACLEATRSDLLLVLAVDLPAMSEPFLRRLLAQSTPGRGVVPQLGDHFEPLAALYPRRLAPLAAKRLAQGEYALQGFIREGIAQGALEVLSLPPAEKALFQNLNTPADLASYRSLPDPLP